MAASICRRNVGGTVSVVLVFLIYVLSSELVMAKFDGHKGIAKDIESPHQDDEAFDCVDIYKQPAFDHPLLKNHVIQMIPSSFPTGSKGSQSQSLQEDRTLDWLQTVECPEGTVPIPKTTVQNNHNVPRGLPEIRWFNQSYDFIPPPGHEYAQVTLFGSGLRGAQAMLNVWGPQVEVGEFSLAQIWIIGGSDDTRNTIEAGWMVGLYGLDRRTRFFIYWTADNYQSKGCYNLDCPGFVQVSPRSYLGSSLEPVSTLDGQQRQIPIAIHQDRMTGNWWLLMNGIVLGYWPSSLFNTLGNGADLIYWGGEIVNVGIQGHHTTTQMGSGHFPSEGYRRSAFISNLKYIDDLGATKEPENLVTYTTYAQCYDLQLQRSRDFGVHFYYGGPGFSGQCPQ